MLNELNFNLKEILLVKRGLPIMVLIGAYHSAAVGCDGLLNGCGAFFPADRRLQTRMEPAYEF